MFLQPVQLYIRRLREKKHRKDPSLSYSFTFSPTLSLAHFDTLQNCERVAEPSVFFFLSVPVFLSSGSNTTSQHFTTLRRYYIDNHFHNAECVCDCVSDAGAGDAGVRAEGWWRWRWRWWRGEGEEEAVEGATDLTHRLTRAWVLLQGRCAAIWMRTRLCVVRVVRRTVA